MEIASKNIRVKYVENGAIGVVMVAFHWKVNVAIHGDLAVSATVEFEIAIETRDLKP